MKIKLMTAFSGGPHKWGLDLVRGLYDHDIEAVQVMNRYSMMLNMLFQPGVDIVHSTVPFLFKLWHKPLVVTIKGDYTIEDNIYQKYYPYLIKQADVVTTPSEYMKDKINVPDAIVIPNAIYPDTIVPVVHRHKGIVSIATIMNFYFKGKAEGTVHLKQLMDSAQLQGVRHIVVGDGPYLQTMKHMIDTNGSTRFSGLLHDSGLVLGNSDIFLYYSYHDNFPNVILEAMAYGLPVLTNKVGAVSEIITNGYDGFVAENDDEYIDIMKELISNVELREKIGKNARKSIEEKFNWNTIINQYIDIYGRFN